MNNEMWKSLIIKILLMVLTPLAGQLHLTYGPTDLSAIAADLADLIVLAYGIYRSSGMKLVPHGSLAIAADNVLTAVNPKGSIAMVAEPGTSKQVAVKVVGALLLGFILLAPNHAQAKSKSKSPINFDPLHLDTSPAPVAKSGACDITLFTNLTVANVITEIQNCAGSVVSAGATPFVADITAALKSATDAKDGTAIACLTPALAIATAAMGTPASGDGSTPAVYPGPILIFQKYREFVTAGGPSICKTAVQSTVNGTMAATL